MARRSNYNHKNKDNRSGAALVLASLMANPNLSSGENDSLSSDEHVRSSRILSMLVQEAGVGAAERQKRLGTVKEQQMHDTRTVNTSEAIKTHTVSNIMNMNRSIRQHSTKLIKKGLHVSPNMMSLSHRKRILGSKGDCPAKKSTTYTCSSNNMKPISSTSTAASTRSTTIPRKAALASTHTVTRASSLITPIISNKKTLQVQVTPTPPPSQHQEQGLLHINALAGLMDQKGLQLQLARARASAANAERVCEMILKQNSKLVEGLEQKEQEIDSLKKKKQAQALALTNKALLLEAHTQTQAHAKIHNQNEQGNPSPPTNAFTATVTSGDHPLRHEEQQEKDELTVDFPDKKHDEELAIVKSLHRRERKVWHTERKSLKRDVAELESVILEQAQAVKRQQKIHKREMLALLDEIEWLIVNKQQCTTAESPRGPTLSSRILGSMMVEVEDVKGDDDDDEQNMVITDQMTGKEQEALHPEAKVNLGSSFYSPVFLRGDGSRRCPSPPALQLQEEEAMPRMASGDYDFDDGTISRDNVVDDKDHVQEHEQQDSTADAIMMFERPQTTVVKSKSTRKDKIKSKTHNSSQDQHHAGAGASTPISILHRDNLCRHQRQQHTCTENDINYSKSAWCFDHRNGRTSNSSRSSTDTCTTSTNSSSRSLMI
jgi:hypothetical protein